MVCQNAYIFKTIRYVLWIVALFYWTSCNANSYLVDAAKKGDVAEVQRLLAKGANIDETNKTSDTALYSAVAAGRIEVIKLLIARGANINLDSTGFTPLMAAALRGDYHVVELLIEAGADINFDRQATALMCATLYAHADVAKLLISRGANVNAAYFGRTPLHIAAEQGYIDLAELLIQNGANINSKNSLGSTPLQVAVARSNNDIAVLLIQHGAKIDSKNSKRKTALDIAEEERNFDFIELFSPSLKAAKPSFACANRQLAYVESVVCAVPLLRFLDHDLSDTFRRALQNTTIPADISQNQQEFIISRNSKCKYRSADCSILNLVEMYAHQFSVLHSLEPVAVEQEKLTKIILPRSQVETKALGEWVEVWKTDDVMDNDEFKFSQSLGHDIRIICMTHDSPITEAHFDGKTLTFIKHATSGTFDIKYSLIFNEDAQKLIGKAVTPELTVDVEWSRKDRDFASDFFYNKEPH